MSRHKPFDVVDMGEGVAIFFENNVFVSSPIKKKIYCVTFPA
jgi:hypothetical protein